ncbi:MULTISPECIES: methylenetetrahydrofolate reductase [NAD(P)H] [Thiothrix]|jgi:methylenetetrahydrofolate reductase (NADPH)|uniref:Methylenetetrahydrofolate reductase n=2 Tax=Thiothrix TaxID=1030 RepID=A0A975F8A2_9GAMM|nr:MULTISPECIES: methylenetetrahydrofolate reductase [NAD(P)H] [Thiothrix]MDX9987693.1 methylenetetrahydrofolate reductase [NAD(P)H] [Thiothrix unzii]OQX15376.1 MAG: methylenetetrahydrofolate reductase [NAD(P)H] [Thiothrix lacustris]QTR52903.1 methylenetetrahydrofolate reductase [NAD(P)H] [Thiothrix unzii]
MTDDHQHDHVNHDDLIFSFEFFPPKTDKGAENLRAVRNELAALNPRFFSVTYGAGGSTQANTLNTVLEIQRDSGIEAAPHLSCVGSSAEQIREILDTYRNNGIKHIVALRGDLPSGSRDLGQFRYANELVEFIRKETGDHFNIEVAAYPEMHPQAPNLKVDIDNFVRKVNAGANSAITQYFFNADAYWHFVDECVKKGVEIPIVPGIMPITNYSQLARFSDMCGAEIPRWLRKQLETYADDVESIAKFGEEFISLLCENLLETGAPGLHFYTMNRVEPTMSIWKNIGLAD